MTTYSDEELSQFKEVQSTAYHCVEAIERELRAGMTEKHVTRMMRNWLRDHGIHEYFHVPFAWFGDRTSFSGFRSPLAFYPTGRRLEHGMPVILDVAPARDGYSADIGYSCCFGDNPVLRKMQEDLQEYRVAIPELVKQRKTGREIYTEIDRIAERQGYANRHQVYPQRVLAHKVFRMQPSRLLQHLELGGFGVRALRGLGSSARRARFGARELWPFWNDEPQSDVLTDPGLWAVEPHLGLGPIGAKWEELLVVTETDAYWLDDDLPHVRRWQRKAAA